MKKIVKHHAEYFALGMVDECQLKYVCDTQEELDEALKYAKEYGDSYDRYVTDSERVYFREVSVEDLIKEYSNHDDVISDVRAVMYNGEGDVKLIHLLKEVHKYKLDNEIIEAVKSGDSFISACADWDILN